MEDLTKVGSVFKYFRKPKVAAIKMEGDLKIGDTVLFKGETTDFKQNITSMQIEMDDVEKVSAGDDVGIKVKERVRDGDDVYRVG